MFTELFGFLASKVNTDKVKEGVKVNLNNRRIKSISSFSSNSIFYFPIVVSDQCQLDEVTMISRALEKQYASFIVACVSLVPFHRVSSQNAWAVDEYLKQFHQNLGISPGADAFNAAYSSAVSKGILREDAAFVPPPMIGVEDFFLKVWNESVENDQDYVRYLVENYISLNDVFNEDAVDPYTKALTDRYHKVNEEIGTWGFVGSVPPEDMFDTPDNMAYEPQEPEMNPGNPDTSSSEPLSTATPNPETIPTNESAANPIDNVKFTLESITDNKIKSCKNRTKLRSMESKLKGLKSKYTKYLIRYKKRYEENEKSGSKKKLNIRFNKSTIDDPKVFMQDYGSYMAIINKKLKLCEARRAELLTRAGKGEMVTATESIGADMSYDEYRMDEAAMKSSTRNSLSDEDFGIPSKRKYPLNDKKHVKLAVQMAGHCNNTEDLKVLAKNIAKRSDALNMDITVSTKNPLHDYMPKAMQEAAEIDILVTLTDLDEQAVDNLIETIDSQLTAGDDMVFSLTEAPSYEEYYDIYQRNERLAKALKDRQDRDRTDAQSGKPADKAKFIGVSSKEPGRGQLDMKKKAKSGDYSSNTFDREIFTKMDMQKCNEMVPTFTKAQIGFIVDDTESVVTRDVLIGIKTYVHRVQTGTLVNEIYQAIMSKRKFLKLVKFISGEERSLSDLIFGMKELKLDAKDTTANSSRWKSAFKHRKRLSKLSVPFIMQNYLPNGTIVMTMNEVEYIKATYGIDIMRGDHCKMIMDVNFLLGFAILDQTNEIVHVMYDGVNQNQFQQYSYTALDREQKNTDREMRDLFRLMNK